jgi:hypothetical protein
MYESIPALIAGMQADLAVLRAGDDRRRYFHATYLRSTQAFDREIRRGGFADGAWLERWDLVFAGLYLNALAADLRGDPVPQPWRVAFDAARERGDLPPVRHVLLGMNAHINFDLPQALIAVITPAEFDDPRVAASRAADHRHVDDVLLARVGAEDDELSAQTRRSLLDRLLAPANRAATRRILTEARAKVWRNVLVLDRARRKGPEEYATVLAELEKLCAARVADLTAPGQVLLKLARHGFGVLLPDAGEGRLPDAANRPR